MIVMKSEVIYLLSRGAKSELELAAFFGAAQLAAVMMIIDKLINIGCIEKGRRQIRVTGNVVRWDCEYRLCTHIVSAA
jgi:hypothetical protein